MWKNLDASTLARHIAWLPLKMAKACVTGRVGFVISFFAALGRAGEAWGERREERRHWKRSDADIAAALSGAAIAKKAPGEADQR